jgi:prevent-host-death family protein
VFVLDSNGKGAIAEAEIEAAAVRKGIDVMRPRMQFGRYDLLLDLRPRLLRVQCKWANREGGVIVVRCRTSRRAPEGYRRATYSSDEIDALGVYCADLDRCYLLPVELVAGRSQLYLRITATKNGQRAALHWAAEYEFAGAVAQWEERRYGIPEAGGSSPPSSTLQRPPPTVVGANTFRNHFGWYAQRAAAGEEIRVTRRGQPHLRLVPEAPRLTGAA